MKNIMMAWELGGGLGHVANRFALRDALTRRGHRVSLAMRDLRTLFMLRPEVAEPVFAAPYPLGTSIAPQRALTSFADVLWHEAGLHDPAICAAMIHAWRGLLSHTQCDLLLADSAPMAMLAAKSLGIPVLRYGISFLHPPATTPYPMFRDWEHQDTSYLPQLEMQSMAHINAVFARLGIEPLPSLAVAFDAPLLLESIGDLDIYGPRNTVAQIPSLSSGSGQTPQWPDGDTPRVFCYTRRDFASLDRLLGALGRLEARTCMFIDGAMPKLPAGAPIHLHDGPVNTAAALAQADVVICAAGNGMVNESLLAGKPMLLLPMQTEQYLTARKVVSLGAALSVTPPIDKPDFLGPLRRLLGEPAFAESARAIAARHADLTQSDPAERVADIIESQCA